jgi:hypothetical protein
VTALFLVHAVLDMLEASIEGSGSRRPRGAARSGCYRIGMLFERCLPSGHRLRFTNGPTQAAGASARAPTSSQQAVELRILVVGDNADTALTPVLLLRLGGHQVGVGDDARSTKMGTFEAYWVDAPTPMVRIVFDRDADGSPRAVIDLANGGKCVVYAADEFWEQALGDAHRVNDSALRSEGAKEVWEKVAHKL